MSRKLTATRQKTHGADRSGAVPDAHIDNVTDADVLRSLANYVEKEWSRAGVLPKRLRKIAKRLERKMPSEHTKGNIIFWGMVTAIFVAGMSLGKLVS